MYMYMYVYMYVAVVDSVHSDWKVLVLYIHIFHGSKRPR